MAANYSTTGKCVICDKPTKPRNKSRTRFAVTCGEEKCVAERRSYAGRQSKKVSHWGKTMIAKGYGKKKKKL